MILLDKPYVSNFLKETIREHQFITLDTGGIVSESELALSTADVIVEQFKENPDCRIYSNSENAINWVCRHLDFTALPSYINQFKNKVTFRQLVQKIYPDFYFQEVALADIDQLDLSKIPMPFIIKPAVGFLSLGVHKVLNKENWEEVKQAIKNEIDEAERLFPLEVINTSHFIVEEMIEGKEFAFDAYFNEKGEPTIMGILHHPFGSETDVSDRVYYTSKEIIKEHLPLFTDFIHRIGECTNIKNFPMHVEVRVTEEGKVVPIEINPMRFGGWCTSADLTWHATGMNPYVYYMENKKPDWEKILEQMDDEIYSLSILDNSTGEHADNIEKFDYEALLKKFVMPLELRKVDFKAYPIFGMLYTKTPKDQFREIDEILKSDLREFVEIK